MMLITCPVTGSEELVGDRRIRSVTNHPTHVAVHVACPACERVHVYRTGRRWEAPGAASADGNAREARRLART